MSCYVNVDHITNSRPVLFMQCMGVGHLVDVTGFATDLDDPPNNQLIYALEDPAPSDPSNPLYVPFSVTEDKTTMSYWIDVTGTLDYETITGYDVRFSAYCEMCCHTVHKIVFYVYFIYVHTFICT